MVAAEEVLDFWFADAVSSPAQAEARNAFWFGSDPQADEVIRGRFSPAVEQAARGGLDDWELEPRSALARILLLDQFPRNLYRGLAQAFATDGMAVAASERLIATGGDQTLAPIHRVFLLVPFEHSELLSVQDRGVALFEQLAREVPEAWQPLVSSYLEYIHGHRNVIARFGRFPHRNAILERTSTPEEEAYLAEGGDTYGQEAPS
ncbi:MAG: DUF924 family protein [Myxococcota bacterium]|nr:DUF924 family protein [Myxococcota bacterium]